jgi:transposase
MKRPIFIRPLTDDERQALERGLRSKDAFVLRRCQMLLASARGERAPHIAHELGCDDQTVLDALHACNERGLDALQHGSSVPHTTYPTFTPEAAERLRALLHRSPRTFGHPTSLWTLDLAAQVSFQQGLTEREESFETIRQTLRKLGVQWKRAKGWITSPDRGSRRKKANATA